MSSLYLVPFKAVVWIPKKKEDVASWGRVIANGKGFFVFCKDGAYLGATSSLGALSINSCHRYTDLEEVGFVSVEVSSLEELSLKITSLGYSREEVERELVRVFV